MLVAWLLGAVQVTGSPGELLAAVAMSESA